MKQYVCSICSYTYDEAKGIPEAGIAPGTKWEDLPDDWKCPVCKAGKSAFRATEDKKQNISTPEKLYVEKEMSAMEMSVICSNLARGCEKQYLLEQAQGFQKLADFFKSKVVSSNDENFQSLLELVESDLNTGYPYANKVSTEHKDRGAMRSLVWSEKVTRMLKSLLERYETEGSKMLENTGVWVCSICGFIYIGNSAPDLCPVCKVPSWKFEKAEGRI